MGTTTVPLIYNGIGYGTVYFPSSITLGTGGSMTFHGIGGAGFPGFDVSATIPGIAVITSPVPMADGGASIIDASQDMSVTWLPISIGQVRFQLDAGTWRPGGVTIRVACAFDGASGSGVVPHLLLSSLKEMAVAEPIYARLSSRLETTTLIDGLTIVTRSYQHSPTANRAFNVTLR